MIKREQTLNLLRDKYIELGFHVQEVSKFNLASNTLSFHKLGSPAIVSFVEEFLEEALQADKQAVEFIRQELME